MKLSDPRLIVVAKRTNQPRALVIAFAGLMKEKRSVEEIVTILDIDGEKTGELWSELMVESEKAAPKKAAKSPKKCGMAHDWKLPEDCVLYAGKWGFTDDEIRREAIGFRDYWESRPDRRDWSLTWKNWIRRKAERLGKPLPAGEEATSNEKKASASPVDISQETWIRAIKDYRRHGTWHKALGPEPDHPGCLAPVEFLSINAANGAPAPDNLFSHH